MSFYLSPNRLGSLRNLKRNFVQQSAITSDFDTYISSRFGVFFEIVNGYMDSEGLRREENGLRLGAIRWHQYRIHAAA
jgi:hypothetical protein